MAGCGTLPPSPTAVPPPTSIVSFQYDAARDVVIAHSTPLTLTNPPTAQNYADALALLPDVSFTVAPTLRLAAPQATVMDDTVTVNYREVAGLQQLAAAQATAMLAALEAWRWVPGVTRVQVLAAGRPLTQLGPLILTQPLTPVYHTYVFQPETGEVGYLVGDLLPANLTQAQDILRRREIRDFPARQGFRPLLPLDTTIAATPDPNHPAVLNVDLSPNFPRMERARLAGLVLEFNQFPTVTAVRFTFGGQLASGMFMRSDLRTALTPYDLLLPAAAALVADEPTATVMRDTATAMLGQIAVNAGPVLVWHEWAALTVTPPADAPPHLFVFRKETTGYAMQIHGARLLTIEMLQRGVPREAIIALRIPGWETLALGP